ncbi:alpha/beta fold hydrolase, partial [Parabacteroides sp. OttesenSCG-928-O15]|nr:alpha/beta fold hydrolase [Parabacteroides sp. OttesenSCG-928-O15]
DKDLPLNVQIVGRVEKEKYAREKIVFSGSRHSRVPGYLAIPKGGMAPYPCVIQIHGLSSSKESWWEENGMMGELTKQLLDAGFAVFALDAEYHGERLGNNDFESPTSILNKGLVTLSRDMITQSVIEYRRGIDYLNTRKEIDMDRIGVIGYSMGGMMTFNLGAVDPRVRASVSCVSPVITVPYLPTAVHNSAPYITDQAFLMLMADKDEMNYSVETARRVYELLNAKTKELIFYDSGHMLPREWTVEAVRWMEKYLK